MKLVSVDVLRERLQLPADDVGVNTTLGRAIDGATAVLEAMTGTVFSRAEHTDLFFVQRGYNTPYLGLYPLELSSGFVDAEVAITVFSGPTVESLSGATGFEPSLVKPELGHLFVPITGHPYYKVTYTAGVADAQDLPGWVAEAAISQSVRALSAMQVGDGKPELSEIYTFLAKQLDLLMDTHSRRRGNYLRPI